MKNHSKSLAILVLALAGLVIPALLWAGPGKECGQKCADQAAKTLNLTADQKTLWDGMQAAHKGFMVAVRDAHKSTKDAFQAEMAKDKPDFAKAAESVKSAASTAVTAAFNAMIDAKAKFLQSLNADQRAAFSKMQAEHHGKKMHHEHGDQEDFQP